MEKLVKVAVDAMGGDHAPGEVVKGAVDAVNEKNNLKVFLVGKAPRIHEELSKYQYKNEQIEVVNAEEEISCDESPVEAIRKKKDSSMVVALKMVKDKTADAFVSAGSSGAILVGGQFVVGRIKGIKRAPLGAVMPTAKGPMLLVDAGANMDAKAEYLLQFAQMGSIYMEDVLGIKNPRVGLVNVGVEEAKGNQLVKETGPLLKECENINYIGSIEAREIPYGAADVVVCDAFAGNIVLKLEEGLAAVLVSQIKEGMMSTLKSKIGALLAKPALKKTLKKFDASEYGGAPLLGLNGLVVKAHGSSSAKEMKNAIIQCIAFAEEDITQKIHEPSRLWNAFIHSSYANERRMSKDKNNERLEFLGDAVLELVTSNYLYRTYQKESEGKLSKIRASLVCEPTLAGCARDINLGKYVLLSKGEDMTGGRSRDSILSDAFEAVIGAIYLDQGIETATKFIETYLFKDVENKVLFFDAKTNLQEIVQGEGKGRLKYVLVGEEGPDHAKIFTVEARLGENVIGTGSGHSKKSAEQHAAFEAIKRHKK